MPRAYVASGGYSPIRRWSLQVCLLLASSIVGVLMAEGLCRITLNPVDYLAADPIHDSILGIRLAPHTAGHDEWGFRNRELPDSAEIVTIGDSQTYGVSAPADLSWPAQLSTLIHRQVYNLALGGYGPVQYEELLRTRALRLRPQVIVVGLYYGNDLWDAYAAVYGLRHWAALRREGIPSFTGSLSVPPARDVYLASLRDWLARRSVVYRLATFTALGGYARGLEFVTRDHPSDIVSMQLPTHSGYTGFTPRGRLRALNLEDSTIREGLRLTLDRLERIAEDCRAARVHLLVALIPTKERVYAPWLGRDSNLPGHETIRALLSNEYEVDRQVQKQLDRFGVRYVDLAKPLRDAAALKAIYPASADGHPDREGYAVIAQAVVKAIEDWSPLTSANRADREASR